MAYDDDNGKLGFHDFEDFAVLIERYLAAPENLSVIRILALTRAIHKIAAGRAAEKIGLHELAGGLRERGLATVPFDTVIRLAQVIGKISYEEDVLARVTLRDLQRVVGAK
jgi:hypothetical protein